MPHPRRGVAARSRRDRSACPRSSNPTRGTFPHRGGRRAITRRRYTPRRSPIPHADHVPYRSRFRSSRSLFHPRLRRARGARRVAPRRHAGVERRGNLRVHPRERAQGAAVSRRNQADDDGERHVSRRLAPGKLRRDRNGASARASDVQGHAVDPQHLPGARPARDAHERLDVLRPHQLLRDVYRLGRESRLGARDGSGPDGQFVHRAERTSTPR